MAKRKTTPNIMGELLGGEPGLCGTTRQAKETASQHISKTAYCYTI